MKKSRYFISLYIIIPAIFSGFSVLSSILAYQMAGYQINRALVTLTWNAVFWILGIGIVAFVCGLILVWLLLRPSTLFVQRATQLPALSGRGSGKGSQTGGDELQQFTHVFKQVTDVLTKMDARQLFPEIIGESRAIRGVLSQIIKVAPTDATVLITGDSGTGKELAATSIFEHSERSDNPFIKINCAAMPAELLESELFGHEKGAFTGAVTRKAGKFEVAHGGTIFLDEIGDMPLILQAKILRVIQEREFDRVGGTRPIHVDVRFIAATNQNLEQMVAKGRFREDLYFRLNVFSVYMPPLKDHKEDIPLLVEKMLLKAPKPAVIGATALQLLMGYAWPGNVRELQNVVERAAVMSGERDIEPEHLPDVITRGLTSHMLNATNRDQTGSIDEQLHEIEKGMIIEALKNCGGVQVKAAESLGINQRSLWHRIKKYSIDVSSIKNDT
ncbi:MAG: sigma-54-dependent Fis family transcriptional regulator [Desulfobacterales bacterium]|nr:sigma-54-dependent Fis family transcriptional regulator [Desulfobacterales bacterium]